MLRQVITGAPPLSNLPHNMKTLLAVLIFGWVIGVTFYGPQIARAINAPEAVKAHRVR